MPLGGQRAALGDGQIYAIDTETICCCLAAGDGQAAAIPADLDRAVDPAIEAHALIDRRAAGGLHRRAAVDGQAIAVDAGAVVANHRTVAVGQRAAAGGKRRTGGANGLLCLTLRHFP